MPAGSPKVTDCRQSSHKHQLFFTTSPTFAGPDPAYVAVHESSSASVTVAEPTLSSTDLITFPVAGSFTVRTCRLTTNTSPTCTPDFFPTFRISVFPETSATNPLTIN